MKFKLTYGNASTVVIDVPDAELAAWLDAKHKREAVNAANESEHKRGAVAAVSKEA